MNVHAIRGGVIKVMVVDDHPLMRVGIASVIQDEPDMVVVAEAASGSAALQAYQTFLPDITLMDLQMPGMDGLEATVAIRKQWPDARIVILTTHRGDVQILRTLQAGASGYLLKSMIRSDLLAAIRSVHAGDRRIPAEVAAELAAHVTDDLLSSRELEVLRCVAAGNTNRVIAAMLQVSEETVKSHVKNVMSKLSARDRTHAVLIALKRGIIS